MRRVQAMPRTLSSTGTFPLSSTGTFPLSSTVIPTLIHRNHKTTLMVDRVCHRPVSRLVHAKQTIKPLPRHEGRMKESASSEERPSFDPTKQPHRRFNPLTQSFILCSPHRAQRPWLGQEEQLPSSLQRSPAYDPSCYLCPGNKRDGGKNDSNSIIHNPVYSSTHIFDNDFPALRLDISLDVSDHLGNQACAAKYVPSSTDPSDQLFLSTPVQGVCRVICFSPKHNLTMACMSPAEIMAILRAWMSQYSELSLLPQLQYVLIFENKGSTMGCSNPHPHGQIWATQDVPEEPRKELESMKAYRATKGSCMLCDYVHLEMTKNERIIHQNDHFVCLVPYWAVWPFETMILPTNHIGHVGELSEEQQSDLADALHVLTKSYDELFHVSFPYSMGIHQAPCRDESGIAHLHLHFYPPLLRSASVKKFLVGFEMLGEPQRDLTAEQAAQRLMACRDTVLRAKHHD